MTPRDAVLGLVVLHGLLAGACLSVRSLEPEEPVELAPGQALAFGRIRVLEGPRELTPWDVDFMEELLGPGDPEIRLALFRVESEKRALHPGIGADGWFTWILPEGTWLVYGTDHGPPVRHDVLGAFQVRAGSEAQYLGELVLQVEVERDSGGEALGYIVEEISVSLDLAAARAFLARRRTGPTLEPVERGFRTSPELRHVFDDWHRPRAMQELSALGLELRPR